MTTSPSPAQTRIARAAGTVMLAFVVSQLTGLVRLSLVAAVFGADKSLDAFNSANRVSETLFLLIAGGALSSAFIPTFTALLSKKDTAQAWKLVSSVVNLVLIILAVLSLILAIFAPQVVRYALATGFADDPAQFQLTVDLLRLMLPSAAIFAMSGLAMAVLNSHQVFLAPALTPAMYQIGQILGVVLFSSKIGIFGLAWGVLLGSVLHLALQIPSLLRLKGQYHLRLGLDDPTVREVARLMGPRLLGVAVVQLNFWINTNLASRMVDGSVTAITLGFALMMMPQAALAQSLATAAMPTFSSQVATGKLSEMRHALSTILRWMVLLALPASVGLILLRIPIVALIYQRGSFNTEDTQMVAWALLWYTLGLTGHSLVEILSRSFYSLHDTRTPVLIGTLAMSLNAGLSILFAGLFQRLGWLPLGGLALANSLATAIEAILLLSAIRRRLDGLAGRRILAGLLQGGIASLAMGIVLWLWLPLSSGLPNWMVALGGVAVGGLVYLLAAWLVRIEELRQLRALVRQKLGGQAAQ